MNMKHFSGLFYLVLFTAISAGCVVSGSSAHAAAADTALGASTNGSDVVINAKDDPPPRPKPGPRDGGADD